MSVIGATVAWLGDRAHYRGPDGVPTRLLEHVTISLEAVVIAAVVALPLGLLLGHTRRGGSATTALTNASRAVPTFGILIIFAGVPGLGVGTRSVLLALALFAVPPLLTNTVTGMLEVDRDTVQAARGLGMSGGQVLRQVELPLALPLIAAGVRTAVVQVIATATLATYVGGGGLGNYINNGYGNRDFAQVTAGALLVAGLAFLAEVLLGRVQVALTPGPRRAGRRHITPAEQDQQPLLVPAGAAAS